MRILPVVVVLLALTAVACGDDNVPVRSSGSEPSGDGVVLDPNEWVATKVTGHDLVAGTTITLRFNDGDLGGSAGCNSLGGTYTVEDGHLVVETLSTTDMGCDQDRMDQDAWLSEFLVTRPSLELDGSKLTLTDGEVTIELTERSVVDPDRSLTGTAWTLDGVIEGDSVSNAAGFDRVVLTLDDSTGRFTATTPCNGTGGEFEVADDGATAIFTPGPSTLRACADPADNELETTVRSVLDGTVRVKITATHLTLTKAGHGLTFVAR